MAMSKRTETKNITGAGTREEWFVPEDQAFRAIFEKSPDVILIVDGTEAKIIMANRSASHVLGYDPNGLAGNPLSDLLQPRSTSQNEKMCADICAHDATFESIKVFRPDGSICPMDLTATMIPWEGKTAIVLTLRDVTERSRMEEELRVAATYDELTGLYNRRHFMMQLEASISAAKRHEFPLSLALCDVDKFKSVNDTYGHVAGDEVLAKFGRLVDELIRTEDFAGRFGGDEFCVVFPHVSAANTVHSLERIRRELGKITFRANGGRTFSSSATFGVAGLTPDVASAKDFLEAADRALYEAKDLGRNRVVVHDGRGDVGQ